MIDDWTIVKIAFAGSFFLHVCCLLMIAHIGNKLRDTIREANKIFTEWKPAIMELEDAVFPSYRLERKELKSEIR